MKNCNRLHPDVASALAFPHSGLTFLREFFDRANQPLSVSVEESKAIEVIALAKRRDTAHSIRQLFGGKRLVWGDPHCDSIGMTPGEDRIHFSLAA